MRRVAARAAIGTLSLLTVVAAGACSEPVDGKSVEEPATEIAFRPCDGFSPEALAAAKIDAASPDRMPDREDPPNHACGYLSRDPYYVAVVSAIGTPFSSIRSDDRFNVLSETEIGGRRALVSDFRGGSACTVSVAIEPGILEFMIGYSELEDFTTVEAACDQATKVATALAPYFPDRL
ncbi:MULTISPECIES: DUF3558 family protein [unclassified Rhodococcus (in: high G+C Gram-positive bacteria)]|uniref:DUF3558 family protein n=1 Tax=unclassified Rhodococcus (in: high G+C Gram-positive bacteria) TaxID=192944 RepID=UPI001639EAD0|nr:MULTISPECIES: DUF3558 family protein [unclassified Rhodococcus (in: high G+C Gram-positive bacteria)]MBC2641749.1 DUF3558 family protein [Rhodococcus sp. 3A]MBC2893506.1 DUF3558 family protein [Rhodococcus sp. 4CII]